MLSAADDKQSTVTLANSMHQAIARRGVVVELMKGAKGRGDIHGLNANALCVPQHGVPEELVGVFQNYDHVDKGMLQRKRVRQFRSHKA